MHDYTPDEEIDLLCDQFERELQTGQPSIESYVERIDDARKPRLLYWLLSVLWQASTQSVQQKQQTLNELRATWPHFKAAIDDVESAFARSSNHLPQIPGYTVKRHAKQGGQGDVFQATQNRTGQEVAIKLVSTAQLESIPETHRLRVIARLEQEIRTAAGLNHPNIVKVFDAGECSDGFYFVMPWIKGGSLADRTSLSQTDAAKIIRSVAGALAEAHASDVLHLDVKPHNILFDEATGQPMLADFGLARLSRETTQSNAIAGTIGYMAPEQAKGATLDVRTDVFGLGATFYELLTGEKAYKNVSIPYDDQQREAWSPTSPRIIRRDVNPELERICTSCLQFDPASRFQSCEEVAAALDRFAFTEDGRRISKMATRTLVTCPLFLVINLLVMISIQQHWVDTPVFETLTWLCMFSMYAVVFYVFGSVSKLDKHSPEHLAVESLWAVWLAKFFAAITIAASLRLMANDLAPRGAGAIDSAGQAMLMCYPMFSALTGFVLATIAARYWRFLYPLAVLCWLASLALMQTVVWDWTLAPLIYGCMATSLGLVWGLKLKQLSREQAPAGTMDLSPTIELPRENA